jgi:hypothetical protein
MGQFKPMVKMMTTEPSVELKLKKGGKVEKKMQMGGDPAMAPAAPAAPARGGMGMPGMAPKKPGLFARRRAMRGMGAGPAGPLGRGGDMMEDMEERKAMVDALRGQGAMSEGERMMARQPMTPAMKKGGKAESMEKKLKEHADKPASKAHKGLKTGGVVMGQGGYKEGGIIKTMTNKTTKMDTAHPDKDQGPTGGVKLGNGGGYKKGGAAKKDCYATGGVVMGQGGYKKGGDVKKPSATGAKNDSGAPVAMPQGRKPAPKAVAINELSGTYKKGGPVMTPAQKRLDNIFQKENAPAMKAAKKMSNEKYGKKMAYGGTPEAVTETERSVTVVPGKKSGGKMARGGSC